MDEKELDELNTLAQKKERTQEEGERYKTLLRKLFKEKLYLGDPES